MDGRVGHLWAFGATDPSAFDRLRLFMSPMHIFMSSVRLHRGHTVLMLRNRLLGSQRDQYSTLSGREALVAIAVKAWNAWREGKTLQTLSWRAEGRRAERFPGPI